MDDKARFLAELRCYCLRKGYKDGWASNKYREKFGVWPDNSLRDVPPAPTLSAKTASWIKSRQIAWAKSKRHRFSDDNIQNDRAYAPAHETNIVPGTLCTEDDLAEL
jgi:hypothetical protein